MPLEVCPENGMVDVATEVEREVFLQFVDGAKVARLACFCHGREGTIRSVHVGLVVLRVVQFHDARRNVGFERAVVVGKFGEAIGNHDISLSWRLPSL